ncbi:MULTISPECIES: hypothetical protein [Clostridium]|uniref:Uncharacterized protein n=2 Tax=Clostridium TaxID=1485 RepID=A0A151AMG8_9CLOT|nr:MULTISPECIES: hypothetical protein [Clostridium]KYH28597.1 hypothetical protein CLCOL_18580 [Clostridium colicanis DSM 13634]PRR74115.1 hypothetical protein CPAL_10530 [Clostridium thermopalmarium DSM 5974]PVZ25443.1 hypothetical protein LX19_00964 [Clostridium thermopalmarium DSM 5974]
MIKKAVLKGSIFTIVLVFILSILNSIFILKTGHHSKLKEGLYKHKNEVYDVALLGSSHMNGAVNPNIIWGEQGITSFNFATAGQPIDVTYYLLKEVLKKRDISVVVLDVYYLGLTEEFGKEGYIRYVLDNMRFSVNKIQAIMHTTPKDQWIYYLFPILKYHDRWKDLQKKDFFDNTSETYCNKGFSAGSDQYGKDTLSDTTVTGTADLPPKSEEYLYKIIDLSKKENFELVFINAPHDYESTKGMRNWHKEPAKMFNKVAEIANETNIPFINYNNLLDEISFNFKTDMLNAGHSNISGSYKISSHLGKFLKENYNLKDRRNDKEYEQWNIDYKKYYEKK